MKKLVKQFLKRFGYDVVRLPSDPVVRQQRDLFGKYGINLVFDIGANVGQFGQRLRRMGFGGQIVSFEPLPDAFACVKAIADQDPAWTVRQTAIGNFVGETQINVSQNSYSSSILDVLPVHVESAPDSAYTHQITVPLQTVDCLIDQYYKENSRLYIKIDTQGFEKEVLEGSLLSLDKITAFQMELSLVPLYQGEMLMHDMVDVLRELGFKLKLIEGGHRSYKTGELLQVEAYFYRDERA